MPHGCVARFAVIEAKDLMAADINGRSDPFVTLKLEGEKQKTKTIDKSLHPVWNQDFTLCALLRKLRVAHSRFTAR